MAFDLQRTGMERSFGAGAGALGAKALCMAVLMLGEGIAHAGEAVSGLRIDGIVRVKKVSPASARVIVVPNEGEVRTITEALSHFTLTLDLQTNYLLSFECNGCVTKQLLFDTHVPAGRAAYEFPFQVTLEPPPTDAPFAYAGPVGLIRYDPAIADFGYDTDYKIARDEVLTKRLEQVRARSEAAPVPDLQPLPAPPAAAAPVPSASEVTTFMPPAPEKPDVDAPRGPFEELAPTRSEVAPLVHPTGERPPPPPVPPAPVRMPPAPPAPKPVEAIEEVPRPAAVLEHDGRTEEVIPEKLRVTTIVRIRAEGRITEYRRVAQYYGGVVYFKDGVACTEAVYHEGTGR